MRIETFKCDRCSQKIAGRRQVMKLLINDCDYGELVDMDLCPECTDKLGGFLGLNQEFPFDGGDPHDGK